jgi:hypothetical protein
LGEALKGHRRVLVHVGCDDFPASFDALLFGTLNRLGAVVEGHRFADMSRAAVVDLRLPGGSGESIAPLLQHKEHSGASLRGCVGVRRALPW